MDNEARLAALEAKVQVMSTAIVGLQLLASSTVKLAILSDRAAVERETHRYRILAEERRATDPNSQLFEIGARALETALEQME